MKAGLLNTRIELFRKARVLDEAGAVSYHWLPLAKLWGDVRQKSGVETIRNDTAVSEVRASIRVRYRAGVESGMRVSVRNQLYEIQAVLPDYPAGIMDLVCVRAEDVEMGYQAGRGFQRLG